MEEKNLQRVKDLIDEIAEYYDLPDEEQTAEMCRLTGQDWPAEDLQEVCCEYWSHHSLEETAYLMFHKKYPPEEETELSFWQYKPGVNNLDDGAVYEKYRLGKGTLKALAPLPLREIKEKLKEIFPGWTKYVMPGHEDDDDRRYDSPVQAEYWRDTHFWLFEYGRETETCREHQILTFSCHNMSRRDIEKIVECMGSFGCKLHIREDKKH